MKIKENHSLKYLNTFGVDVKALFFADVESEEQLLLLLTDKNFRNLPWLILGGGSNILFTADFPGLVIKISIPGIEIVREDNESVLIRAGAGEIWHNLVLYCVERNLGGIENLSLIPGTVGAAPMQNIGAYGQEIKNVFESLEGYYIENADKKNFNNSQCSFGYRDSIFKRELKNKFIITSVTLRLSKYPKLNLDYGTVREEIEKLSGSRRIDKITIKNVSDVICKIRQSKLPDPAQLGNAGSFFKNPEVAEEKFNDLQKRFPAITGYKSGNEKVKLAAGWLIEQCGWKGRRVGNTGAHAKQALVLLNYGGAAGKEILDLSEQIKKSVSDKFGIVLEEEINIV